MIDAEYEDRVVTAAELKRLAALGWEVVAVFGPATLDPGSEFRVLLRRYGDVPERRPTAADRLQRARTASATETATEPPKRKPGRPRKEASA